MRQVVLSSDQFLYNKETKSFSAEISELGEKGFGTTTDQLTGKRVLLMRSTRTNRVATFMQMDANHGMDLRENERQFWQFSCIEAGYEDLSVVVFND